MSNLAEACPDSVSISTTPDERSRAGERGQPGFRSRTGKTANGAGSGPGREIQPLTVHSRRLVNGAGLGRDFSPGTASDSTSTTPGDRSRTGKTVQPGYSLLTAHPRQQVNGAGPGRQVSPCTASDSTPIPGKRSRTRKRHAASSNTFTTPGKRSGAGERVQPGYSL